jgi:molybdate transport system substrate-binding protein
MRGGIFGFNGVVTIALAFWSAPAQADGLRVLATGVFEFAVRDLADPFKRQNGQDVSFTIVNAGAAAAKLEAGESYDVILSSSASLNKMAAAGNVVAVSKLDVGRMRLGVAVKQGAPFPDLKTANALRQHCAPRPQSPTSIRAAAALPGHSSRRCSSGWESRMRCTPSRYWLLPAQTSPRPCQKGTQPSV